MKLLVVGAGGHGRVVADAAEASREYSEIAFLDERFPDVKRTADWHVVGKPGDLAAFVGRYDACIAAFGDSALRIRIVSDALRLGLSVHPVIHPRAVVSSRAKIGDGCVVLANSVVNIGAALDIACIVNTSASVDHDCKLAIGVHICPGARLAGNVIVGEFSWIGIGASVKQGIKIGARVTVGAGAACIRDIPDDATVVGVPAKEISR